MMSSNSPAFEICVSTEPVGYTRVAYIRHAGSNVVSVNFSAPKALPNGSTELLSFLNEFDEDPLISEQLPEARREVGAAFEGVSGASIRTLRLRLGMSQAELAAEMGTSQAAISAIENRIRKPGEESIRDLAKLLNVDFNTLMLALENA